VAEAERDRIRERATEVKADQRKRGRYLGGIVPFGWRVGDDGHLVPMLLALVDLRTVILLTLGAAADTGRWLDSPDGQCCQPFFSRLRICRGYGGRRITGWSLWLFKGRAGFGYALCCLG